MKEPTLALVIIDHIGLLSAPIKKGERYQELGKISSESKALAMELNVCVILTSQLNRQVEERTDRKPRMSDIRESGGLEQDCDLAALLYREKQYNPDAHPHDLAELDIQKNREGSTGIIKLRFNAETVSFSDWTEPQARDYTEAATG